MLHCFVKDQRLVTGCSVSQRFKRFAHLQVSDVKRLLVDVDGVGPRSQTPHGGQVTAVAPHGLNDEDAPLGATGRLFDAVTRLNDRAFGKYRTILDCDEHEKRTIKQRRNIQTLHIYKLEH